MEIVHDRERERYSKHISRTFTRGTYYLEVNANHPDYILRTRVLPVPPYDEPSQAVEAGMHYIMNVGDAWFAQVPREGNIYVRSANMHDTATRCTACHPSSFSTEANLVAHRNGYPIRSKSNFQYVIDRLYNSITPLYGDDGLYWQRFIAIPLQAQGKQGSILLDFEREVSGQKTKTDRAVRAVPASGRGGRATTCRRTSSTASSRSTASLASPGATGGFCRNWPVEPGATTSPSRRPTSRQSSATGRPTGASRTFRIGSTGSTRGGSSTRQNMRTRSSAKPARSFPFKTPTAAGTRSTRVLVPARSTRPDSSSGRCLQIGLPRDHPALAKALRYLLAQQQDFGGWFQTTTHENFRTPMRETRYAVMALAEAFPRPGAPGRGWANRDHGPARLPRARFAGPHPGRPRKSLGCSRARSGLDSHEQSRPCSIMPSRSSGRRPRPAWGGWGRKSRSRPWSAGSTIRPRSSGARRPGRCGDWATRGWEWTRSPRRSKSPNPRTAAGPPGSSPINFRAWITRLDLAESLIGLTRDPDLWTRLQALRTLRQWFYRTQRPGTRPSDRRHLPRADGRARCCRSSART